MSYKPKSSRENRNKGEYDQNYSERVQRDVDALLTQVERERTGVPITSLDQMFHIDKLIDDD